MARFPVTSHSRRSIESRRVAVTIAAMTWRTKRMMRRSKPRVSESRILGGTISILWSAVGLAVLIMLAIGLFLYLPGTNAIDSPVVTVP